MVMPVSVRLDEDVRAALDEEARARGVGLSTYLRELATEAARELRRERIRRQSRAVGEHAAQSPEAAGFYEAWGTPRAEGV
jgi:GNAT superfamily N-acetyltransferase